MQADVSQMDRGDLQENRMSILAGLTRLRQICWAIRVCLLRITREVLAKWNKSKTFSGCQRKQSSCSIIFSVHKHAFYLRKELNELGLETFYLRGSTKPQDRLTMANAFNEGEKMSS